MEPAAVSAGRSIAGPLRACPIAHRPATTARGPGSARTARDQRGAVASRSHQAGIRGAEDRTGDGRIVPRHPAHLPGERRRDHGAVAGLRAPESRARSVRGGVHHCRSPTAACRRACRSVRANGLAPRGRFARPRYRCRRAIGAARAGRRSGVADSLWRNRRRRVVVPLVARHPAHSAGRCQRPRPGLDRGGARGPRGARTDANAGHRRRLGSGSDRREQRH